MRRKRSRTSTSMPTTVLAVAGAARERPAVLILGLIMSVALMGVAATFIARLLHSHRWIAYSGVAMIFYVSAEMIFRGIGEVWPVVEAAVS